MTAQFSLMALLDRCQLHQQQLYLLLDVNTQEHFWENWGSRLYHNKPYWRYYFQHTQFDHLKGVSPLLCQVVEGEVGNDLLNEISGERWGCLFSSPLPLDTLLKHLQTWFSVIFPNGQEHQFRWYSPKTMRLLLTDPSFVGEDSNRLTHVLGHMALPTPESLQYLQVFEQAQDTVAHKSHTPDNPWLYLEPEQLAAINGLYQQEYIADLALEMFRINPKACMPLPFEQVLVQLEKGLALAKQYKNCSDEMAKYFAFQRFFIASDFYLFPDFKRSVSLAGLGHALWQLKQNPNWQHHMRLNHHNQHWLASR